MITKMKTKLGNVLTLLSIFFISLLVTGCATTKEYVTKYETVYVVLEPPKELYNPKKRIKPPNRKEYLGNYKIIISSNLFTEEMCFILVNIGF